MQTRRAAPIASYDDEVEVSEASGGSGGEDVDDDDDDCGVSDDNDEDGDGEAALPAKRARVPPVVYSPGDYAPAPPKRKK